MTSRRLALAADRPYRGHLPGDALRADGRPREAVAGEAFNVGADGENYRIREIAEIVARDLPRLRADRRRESAATPAATGSPSPRSASTCRSFETAWTAERGARQLKAVFERIGLTREMFEAEPFTRLKELKHLRATGQIDKTLFWKTLEPIA